MGIRFRLNAVLSGRCKLTDAQLSAEFAVTVPNVSVSFKRLRN